MKNSRKRNKIVILFLIIFAIYMLVNLRGEYLRTIEIDEKFVDVFWYNTRFKFIVGVVNFLFLYITTYITTKLIFKGAKKFFDDEKKQMPKLPNKSICLILSTLITLISSSFITKKAIYAFNSAFFGVNDPIFNIDIGYYVFIKPFISTMILYFIILAVIYTIYIAAYYIIIFNKYFQKGVEANTLKRNLFIKQITWNIVFIVIAIASLTIVNTHNVLTGKFLSLSDGLSLYGAGAVDVGIKIWGYRIFALVILICGIRAISHFKKENFKKVAVWLCAIPIYLVILFLVLISYDLIFVRRNEFDKEKQYIANNIKFTKSAYDINIEEKDVINSGAIQNNDIDENKNIIENINILNEENVLNEINSNKTDAGYYKFNVTKPGAYKIDNENKLVYISPREIDNNDSRAFNGTTYEYTHGYGIVINDANKTDENGNLSYLQSDFSDVNNSIKVTQPRIYFGTETNEPIIVNANNKEEFDYPINTVKSQTNKYDGQAGVKLGFIDRLILGIKERKIGIAFACKINSKAQIISSRNVRERAKSILPYIKYDENPYMIVTDSGKLVWILDGYTTSNNYPYSQETIIQYEGYKEKINYIRNSVKVTIDAYDGTTKFYITDETDPIIMSYKKMYKNLFETTPIPKDIQEHIVYSEFLYSIQAKMLETHHNVQPEILYRQDDIWDICKENKTRTTSASSGTYIKPYYTFIKNNNTENLGLITPYTMDKKQNIISYLEGTYDENNNKKLVVYKFKSDVAILGTTQLDILVEQDETISKELNLLNTAGTRIIKNIFVIPVNNTLLYVEPIYQEMLNEETNVPVLKKIIVASGNKVAIGENIQEALNNLLSQEAIKLEYISENKTELIEQIIEANNNLEQSRESGNWEMIGKDMAKLQALIKQLETINEQEKKNEEKKIETGETDTSSQSANADTIKPNLLFMH